MTTAAILEYIVTANTAQANAALAKTQGQLTTMGKTSKVAGANVKAGFAVAGAAAVAAGVAIFKVGEEFDKAYDKIQARTGATGKEMGKLEKSFKSVVKTVPTDFDSAAEAVAGLNQRLGETGKPLTKLARQVTALSQITGEDVTENVEAVTRLFGDWSVATKDQTDTLDGLFRVSQKTGASVSDLARNMVQFGAPLRNLGFGLDQAAAMFGAFEKTGVNITTVLSGLRLSVGNFAKPSADLAKTMKDLNLSASDTPAAIIEMFKQIKTLGSESAATALAIDAFGKRAGPDLVDTIRGGKFELDALIKTFQSGDGTIRQAERRTRDFSEEWTLFKNNLATVVEPVAVAFFKAVGDGMRMLRRINFDAAIGAIEDFWKKAGLLRDVVKRVAEGVMDTFGGMIDFLKGGVKLISSILTGDFRSAWDAVKQIFRAGVRIALAPIKGMISLVKDIAGRIGDALGGVFRTVWGTIKNIFAKGADFILGSLTTIIDGIAKVADVGSKLPGPLGDAWDKIQAGAEDAADEINRWREDVRNSAQGASKAIGTATGQSVQNLDRLADVAQDKGRKTGQGIEEPIKKGVRNSQQELGHLSSTAGQEFGKVTSASKKMRDGTTANFSSLNASVNAGLKNIGENTNSALKAFGVKEMSFAINERPNDSVGGHHTAQTGWLVPGYGTGDKVKALLEPGEVVVNREAVKAMGGANKVNAINSTIPRFQQGGQPGGANLRQSFDVDGAQPGFVPLMNFLNSMFGPIYVMSGFRGGSTVAGTGAVSNHASGRAVDISTQGIEAASSAASLNATGALADRMDQLHSYMAANIDLPGDFLWRTYTGGNHFNHIHRGITSAHASDPSLMIDYLLGLPGGGGMTGGERVKRELIEGPDGMLKDLGQAALDKARKAANKLIAKKAATSNFGGGPLVDPPHSAVDVGPGALSRGEINDLVKAVGLPNWFGWVALAESGLNPNATSYANAQGLWQILMPLHQGLVNQHGGNAYNPMTNALVAAELERQSGTTPWNPSKYDGFIPEGWGPHQGEPFKRGGIVKGFQEGGKILLVGDSITKMALDAGGFPGGWDHPGTVVGGKPAHTWGDKQVEAHWGDSDYLALAFMMGTNDAKAATNLSPALNTVKGVIGKAGLSLMTFPPGSTDVDAKNRLVQGFGADAIASMSGIQTSDGLHPSSIGTFRQRIKDAGNAAKKAMKGGGGGSNGGGGGEETAAASDLSSAGMSFGEWVQSVLGDGSKGTQGLSERVRKAIKQTTDNITLWDAVIGGQEIRDAMSTSESGSEMGPLERANQIVMNENLLMVLKAMKAWLLEGLKTPRLKPTARTRLEELLEGIQGVRGSKTGRLLDVEAHLDELRNPDTSGSGEAENNAARIELLEGLLRDANLRTAVSQAQYKVFSEFAGGFAAGGYIPSGQWGVVGEAGPEVVGGPMSVSPMGGTTVIINGDIVNTPAGKQPVEVRGAKAAIEQGTRGYGRRPLGSARGY